MFNTSKTLQASIACLLYLLLSLQAYAETETETIERSFDVKSGGVLEVDTSQGDVVIDSWDKDQVFVLVSKQSNGGQSSKDFELVISENNNKVQVRGESTWRSRVSLKYRVKVPQKFNVEVKTGGGRIKVGSLTGNVYVDTSGGSIHVGDVDGNVNADTSGGRIEIGNITGKVNADTSGGSIRIAGAGKEVRADTSGGSINIGPTGGNIHADTSGGSIRIAHSKGDIFADTSGGSISLAGSDGSVKVETSGGNITIENVAGAIDAETSGGGIKIYGARSSVYADTSGGNVELVFVEEKPGSNTRIELQSSGGSIKTQFPDTLKATVSAYLALGANHSHGSRKQKIYSDFPLTIQERDGDIVAEGSINGGGVDIRLRTSHGHIKIKKLVNE